MALGGTVMNAFGFGQPSKISNNNSLPNGNDDDNNNDNGNNGNNGNGGNSNQNANGNNGNGNNQNQNGADDWLNIFGNADDDTDFNLPEDLFTKKNQGDDNAGGNDNDDSGGDDPMVQLQGKMKEIMGQHKIRLEDIPDDFDINDKPQMVKLLNGTVQQAVQAAMSVFALPMQEAMNQMETRLGEQMLTNSAKNTAQQKAKQAFEPFQIAFADQKSPEKIQFARMTFQQALAATKDVQKAQKATQSAIKSLFGVDVNLNMRNRGNGNGGGSNNDSLGLKTGEDAINSFLDM